MVVVMYVMLLFVVDPTAAGSATVDRDETLSTSSYIHRLLEQGIRREQILGIESLGVPRVCGTGMIDQQQSYRMTQTAGSSLPPDTRGWECIPGVIRNDGIESFRLEVNVNGEVNRIILETVSANLISYGTPPFELHDDGLGTDKIAGDMIYTAGPFSYNTFFPLPSHYLFDTDSPEGLHHAFIGNLIIEELDGERVEFLIPPEVGILQQDIQNNDTLLLTSDMIITPSIINIKSKEQQTQLTLRFLNGDLSVLTNRIYNYLPDVIDFFVYFSLNKIELLPKLTSNNFHSGVHSRIQTNFTGTGAPLFDRTGDFGSNGALLSNNVLDVLERGVVSNNATHEIIHQWEAHLNSSLGLSDNSHYHFGSSTASMVGGKEWIDNGDGTFMLNCEQGRGGAHHASPIDKYMMGLIDGNDVPTIHVDVALRIPECGLPVVSQLDVTIEDIQTVHGIRTPGPKNAQRDFNIAFVAESHNRLLNATELTYYSILAEHYTKELPEDEPDPYVGFNWAPITRFFGEDTTWDSRIRVFDDFDIDGDIDVDDYAEFVECLAGPDVEVGKSCRIFDRNNDLHIDLAEFARYQNIFSGPVK